MNRNAVATHGFEMEKLTEALAKQSSAQQGHGEGMNSNGIA